jgi:hypothetical protein
MLRSIVIRLAGIDAASHVIRTNKASDGDKDFLGENSPSEGVTYLL